MLESLSGSLLDISSNASNAFLSSPEGRVLEIKAEYVARQEAERLLPIIQSNLHYAASLGGDSTLVYPQVTRISDSLFESKVDIFRGVYIRGCNVNIAGAPSVRDEIAKRIRPEISVTNVSGNGIYVRLR